MDYLEFNSDIFSKELQVDPGFKFLINEIRKKNISSLQPGVISETENIDDSYNLEQVGNDHKESCISLSAERGSRFIDEKKLIGAYDESILFYNTIEGKLARVSYVLLFMYNGIYYPLIRLSSLFCTASNKIHDKFKNSMDSMVVGRERIDVAINDEIIKQKTHFIVDNCFKNLILLIDGPLPTGYNSEYFYENIESMTKQNIIPVFIVKNSNSSLVVENTPKLKGDYNSDFHFVNESLVEGSRSSFYEYSSNIPHRTKIFCYLKYKKSCSPIRVEFSSLTFYENRKIIDSVMDMIYYLICVQGSSNNSQVRLIAVAEKYAKEALNMTNFEEICMELTPTMNQKRGMLQ